MRDSFLSILLIIGSVSGRTNIATFSDTDCQVSYRNLDGPNGYTNGTCTMLQSMGNYTSFQVVNMGPGCTVTIYGPDSTLSPCSATDPQFASLGRCYNSTWRYYSIDSCISPELLPSSSSAAVGSANATTAQTLSAGVISGVAIGAVVGVSSIAAVIILLLLRRRRARATNSQPTNVDNIDPQKAERSMVSEKDLSPPPQEIWVPPAEMGSEMSHELPAHDETFEIGDGRRSYMKK